LYLGHLHDIILYNQPANGEPLTMAQEGIATLPQSPENAALPPEVAIDAGKNELLNQFGPEAMSEYERTMGEATGGLNMPLEELQQLQQIIDYILKNYQNYPAIRKELLAQGIREEDLPPEFDVGYFSTMQVMLSEAIKKATGASPQVMPMQGMAPPEGSPLPPPQSFAKGGLAGAAESLRQKGRYGDTVLAHINPEEAMMLKAMGGSGTINPATGLPEFNIFKKVGGWVSSGFKAVANVAKAVVASPVGRIVATVALTAALGPGGITAAGLLSAPMAAAVAAGSINLIGGGDIKSSLISAATGYGMASLAPQISGMFPGAGNAATGAAPSFLNAVMTGGAMGTGYGLLTGQNLQNSLKMGLTGGAIAGAANYLQAGPYKPQEGAPGAPINDFSQNVSMQPDGTYGPNPVSAAMPDPYSIGDYAYNLANQSGTLLPGQVPVDTPTMGTSTFDRSMSNASQFGVDMGSSEVQPTFSSTVPTSAGSGAGASAPKSGFMDYVPDFFKTSTGSLSVPATTAAVLGIGALTGGFDQQDPSSPGLVERDAQGNVITGSDLVEQNPDKYVYTPNIRTAPVGPYAGNTTSPDDVNMINTRQFGQGRNTPFSNFIAPFMSGGRTPSGISSALPQPYNTADMYNFLRPRRAYADGGITQAYPRRTGGISGPGTGTSDDIPAMLSDGEFVLTAKAVRGAGKGSRREGAKKLYRMMHALEKKAK
jgi:hypothetical protein